MVSRLPRHAFLALIMPSQTQFPAIVLCRRLCTAGQPAISSHSRRGGSGTGPAIRLDLRMLEQAVSGLFGAGLAPSTARTYRSGYSRYLNFCERAHLTPLPASERVLCLFVAFLVEERVTHSTIKCYLSAVRHLHIQQSRLALRYCGSNSCFGVSKGDMEKSADSTPSYHSRCFVTYSDTLGVTSGQEGRNDALGNLLPRILRIPSGRGIHHSILSDLRPVYLLDC